MTDGSAAGRRVAVITGASAGIGEAAASRLAARGCDVVLGARRVDRVERLSRMLVDDHDVRALGLHLDVRDPASVAAFADAAEELAGGAVHILVNNAGLARGVARIPAATEDDEQGWAEMLDTNVLGLLRVTRRLVPAMAAAGRGHVVNLGSLAGIEPYEGGSVYCATKAGVRMISRVLRMELLGTGVRVTCVNPGLVETEFALVRLGSPDAAERVYAGMTPCTADDIAAMVEWVVDQPAHVNVEEVWVQPTDQASAQRVHRARPRADRASG